jgi:hypothetical protein
MALPLVAVAGTLARSAFQNLIIAETINLLPWLIRVGRIGYELATRSNRLDEDMAQEMVDRMRRDAPRRSGRLINGIDWFREGEGIVVRAEARRPGRTGDGPNYAAFVERGTRAGVRGRRVSYVADSGYFDLASDIGGVRRIPRGRTRTRRQLRTHPGTQPQPFFFHNIEAVMRERRVKQIRAMLEAGAAVGFALGPVDSNPPALPPPSITLGPGEYSVIS